MYNTALLVAVLHMYCTALLEFVLQVIVHNLSLPTAYMGSDFVNLEYSGVYSVQFTVECTVYSLQWSVQCTVYSGVYSEHGLVL